MTIDIKQHKPWYHGVKWFWSARYLMSSHRQAMHSEHVQIKMTDFGPEQDHMDLIAAAPETATERDNLKAENERIREVFKYADTQDWDFLMGLLEKAERHDQDAEAQLWVSIMQDVRGIIQGVSQCK